MSRRRLSVLLVAGTRPECIKLAPVVRELAASARLWPTSLVERAWESSSFSSRFSVSRCRFSSALLIVTSSFSGSTGF